MELTDVLNKVVMYGEKEAGRASKIKDVLENLVNNIEKSNFDIAELFYEVKSKGYYNSWGYNTFSEYVKTLNIKSSKANYLERMARVMDTVNIPRSKYEPLGIGKLREITSLNPEESYKNPKTNELIPMSEMIAELTERASLMSLEEVREYVRALKGLTGDDALVWLNLSIKKAALDEVIRPALELAKVNIGSVGKDDDGNSLDASDGRALELICADYLADPANHVLPEGE